MNAHLHITDSTEHSNSSKVINQNTEFVMLFPFFSTAAVLQNTSQTRLLSIAKYAKQAARQRTKQQIMTSVVPDQYSTV